MRKLLLSAAVVAASCWVVPAFAATTVVSGTITSLGILGSNPNYSSTPEVVVFQITNQPTSTGCPAPAHFFSFSPASVTDANSRRNLLATLFTARAAGLTISVAYDNAGAYCDVVGYAAPFEISL
jgi:hypothetical protein